MILCSGYLVALIALMYDMITYGVPLLLGIALNLRIRPLVVDPCPGSWRLIWARELSTGGICLWGLAETTDIRTGKWNSHPGVS